MIHTIGDSHSMAGWHQLTYHGIPVHVHHLGPRLMHSVARDGLPLPADFTDGDTIIITLGEIDCRRHIKKHAINGDYATCIDALVLRYEDMLSKIKWDCKLAIFNVVPPTRLDSHPNKAILFDGSDSERLLYTKHINSRLQEMSDRRGWLFIDVFDKYCDNEGFLRPELSDGTCHIGNHEPLVDFIKQNMSCQS